MICDVDDVIFVFVVLIEDFGDGCVLLVYDLNVVLYEGLMINENVLLFFIVLL